MPDETKKYLINVESNLDEYAKRADEARKRVDEFIQSNADLLDKNKEMTPEMERRAAQLKVLQQDYKNAQKAVENATRVDKAQVGSYEQLYQAWKNAQTQLKLMPNAYNVSANGVRTLSAEYLKQKQVVEDAKRGLDAFGKGVADNRLNVGNYSEAIEGALGQMRNLPGAAGQAAKGVSGLTAGFKAMTASSPLLIITLIIGAFKKLKDALQSTDTIGTNLTARFEQLKAILDVIRQRIISFASAVQSLFKGEWQKAGEQFRDTFTGIGEQMQNATKAAWDYIQAMDVLNNSKQNWISDVSEIENAIAKLEYTAMDRSKSYAERKKAIDEAIKLSSQRVEKEKEFAKQELDIAINRLAQTNGVRAEEILAFTRMTDEEQANASESLKLLRDNNEAKLVEIEELYAKWINADTKFFDENKRNISRMTSFEEREQQERDKAQAERDKKRAEDQKKIEDAKAKLTKELEDYKKFIQDQKIADEKAQEEKRQRILEQQEWEREQQLINQENLLQIAELNNENEFSIQRQRLETQRQLEVQSADQTGADVNLINEKYRLAQKQIDELEVQSKLSLYAGFAQNIAQIFGEQTAIGKLAGIAQATINTYQAASEALAAYPPPFSYVAMASAIVAGIANVKKIIAVKSGLPGDTAGGSVPTPTAITGSQAVQRTFAQQVGSTILTQPTLSQQQVNALPNQNVLTAEDIASAVAKIPAPIVTVEDINARADEARKVEVRGTI